MSRSALAAASRALSDASPKLLSSSCFRSLLNTCYSNENSINALRPKWFSLILSQLCSGKRFTTLKTHSRIPLSLSPRLCMLIRGIRCLAQKTAYLNHGGGAPTRKSTIRRYSASCSLTKSALMQCSPTGGHLCDTTGSPERRSCRHGKKKASRKPRLSILNRYMQYAYLQMLSRKMWGKLHRLFGKAMKLKANKNLKPGVRLSFCPLTFTCCILLKVCNER